ncbi:MAG: response regulator [Pseudonocardiaceae bacterium]
MIRLVVAENHAAVRAGFVTLLSSPEDLEVVGEATDGAHAIEVAARTRPDVVVMDIRMPHLDGIEATRRITAAHPYTRVLVLTTFDLDEYVHDVLRAGASGFLLKDATADELITGVRVVVHGDALLAPTATRRLIAAYLRHQPQTAPATALDQLTDRERDVLRQIGLGRSNTEIAAEFVVSENTLKTHVSRVFAKLSVRDRAQAVVLAYKTGLVTPGNH